ncbi:MAG TPA: ATP-grasp domain-containing protein [Desulfobacterales bacterium]|nr:ATP-grasp domain-containing protein [Desulfobacterales bacterium]
MKIAVVHNINQSGVIYRFGILNKEMYFRNEIDSFIDTLQNNGHMVQEFDGDKFLFKNLESFLPVIRNGYTPEGLVFNLAYGIQGNSRYTHIPAMLELAGIPYTGSGPLTHSIALDKEMTKRILLQAGIPTPAFIVIQQDAKLDGLQLKGLKYPLIIKPKSEAGSFGISVVESENELIQNIASTLKEYNQDLVVEEYLDGRELNVGLLGNGNSVEAFKPVEIDFNETGDKFQSATGKKDGSYGHICPANIPENLTKKLQEIAKQTFLLLKCCDYARVDFRLDAEMNPYVLEINSMAAIHEKGSYFHGAKKAGFDYRGMINRMVEVAVIRYKKP